MNPYRKLKFILKIDWINSLRVNFHLPFSQARHMPILLFRSRVTLHNAQIQLLCNAKKCCFGMIKLGLQHAENVVNEQGVNIKMESGKIIFRGSGIIGNGSSIETMGGTIDFGKNFGITGDFHIASKTLIQIGKNFSSSWDVSLYDTDFHDCINPSTGAIKPVSKPISIGDNVWICQQSLIMKGGGYQTGL